MRSYSPVPPVSCDVAHEQDAGVHVQVEGGGTKAAVDAVEEDGAAAVMDDPEGQREADQEVSGRQVPQVDGHTAGHPQLSLAEVNLQGETVKDQPCLQEKQGGRNWNYRQFGSTLRLFKKLS